MGGDVLKLPGRAGPRGSAVAGRTTVTFPTLHRGVVTTTREEVERYGLTDVPLVWQLYTLDRERSSVVGSVEWSETAHIVPGDCVESVVVRKHRDLASAHAYMTAVEDAAMGSAEGKCLDGEIHSTADGIYTMAWRTTEPEWPGALAIYIATLPTDNGMPGDEEEFATVIGPDGSRIDAEIIGCRDL